MRLPIELKTAREPRRLFACLGVLVFFGVLFVLPLCMALALCAMPCCHHENSASGSIASGDRTACETECGVRSAGATPATVAVVAPQNGLPRTSPVVVAVAHLPATPAAAIALEHPAEWTPGRAGAPLLALNSVFRI